VAAAMVGCAEPPPMRAMTLGNVDKDVAFTAAKEVVAMYFPIESADPATEVIKCRPKMTQDYQERLLGGSPTRQVARVELVPQDGQIFARVSVAIQQHGAGIQRSLHTSDPYDPVPHQTPAQIDAATTTEQNETWKTVGYAYEVERKILGWVRGYSSQRRRLGAEFGTTVKASKGPSSKQLQKRAEKRQKDQDRRAKMRGKG